MKVRYHQRSCSIAVHSVSDNTLDQLSVLIIPEHVTGIDILTNERISTLCPSPWWEDK